QAEAGHRDEAWQASRGRNAAAAQGQAAELLRVYERHRQFAARFRFDGAGHRALRSRRHSCPPMTGAVLLDTCAIIFFMRSQRISKAAMAAVESASTAQSILISAISAWEVGLIERKAPCSFTPDAKSWFAQMLTHPGATLTPLTPE